MEEDLFDKVYVLGKQTIHPNQLLQTLFRYRRAESIELHLSNNYLAYTKPSKLTPNQVLSRELNRTPMYDINDDEFERLRHSPAVKILAERINLEHQLRHQYVNNFLGLLEIHKFPLQRIPVDEGLTAQGILHSQSRGKASKSPWRPKRVAEYIAVLCSEDTEQLCLSNYLIRSLS